MWMALGMADVFGDIPTFSKNAAVLIFLAVLWMGCNPCDRYRYRHIPGPFAWPFIGNVIPIATLYHHVYYTQLRSKYGPIFKVWMGTTPWVVICEPDSIRKVAYKCNNRFQLDSSLLGDAKYMFDNGLAQVKSDTWRLMRKAWDPALLHRSSLDGYAPIMHEAGQQLVHHLRGAQQRGEVLDIAEDLGKMTMQVVGTCAFGLNFSGDDGWGATAPRLMAACVLFFRCQEIINATLWMLPILAFPPLAPLFARLAYLLPDRGHSDSVQAQEVLIETAGSMIQASRVQRQHGEQAARGECGVHAGGPAAAPALASWSAETPAGEKGALKRVLPGSFAALLERWNSKYQGEKEVSDKLLAAQVNTFLLAGYDTTANALAFLIYFLSTHPEAQGKLQQELDAVLGGREPTLDDIPKLVYTDACLKESMRLRPTAFALIRQNEMAAGALNVLGWAMPPGARMLLFTFGIHRDPAYWERPEEYLPERFLPETGGKLGPFNENAYLPFGAGGRKCVGYKFAEQEMMLVVARLFQSFTFTRPAGEGPLLARSGFTHSPIGGVKVLVGGRQ